MLTFDNSIWRETQLKWYGGTTIEQDYLLEKFIETQKISKINFQGNSAYLEKILGNSCTDAAELCIFIVNQPFKFTEVARLSNQYITNLAPGGILYLAINKFLAEPETYANCVDDYDQSILRFFQQNISLPIIDYVSGADDHGDKFNWVHPLTRFYFKNASII